MGTVMQEDVEQITIIGPGLLGGSVGLGLRQAGFTGRIVGVGHRAETVARAREKGCIDIASTDIASSVPNSQWVIVATPLGAFSEILGQLAKHDHDGLIITDVGSTKRWVCDQARQLLPQPNRFVGSHPMAGGERHGPEYARADLFRDKPCILIEEPDTDPDSLNAVEDLWRRLGMRLTRMSAQQHDETVALISHLPHLTAVYWSRWRISGAGSTSPRQGSVLRHASPAAIRRSG